MSSSGYHPQIGSIIKFRDQIYLSLYVHNNIESFLDQSIGLMALLKEEHFSKELTNDLDTEIKYLSSVQSRKRRTKHLKSYRKKYNEWFRKLNKVLWDGKYLENKTYEFKIEEDDKTFG